MSDALSPSIDRLITQALDHYGKGELVPAVSLSQQVLSIDSQNSIAHFVLGLAHIASGNADVASQYFSRAVELRQVDPMWHQIAGVSFESQGRFAEAQMQFEAAVAIKPDFFDALIHHAQVCLSQELFSPALASYLQALSLDPASTTALDGIQKTAAALKEFAEVRKNPRGRSAGVPESLAIVVNGTECVAGVFVMRELRDGLGLTQRMRLTNELRDDCTVITENVKELLAKGGICHSHIFPRTDNLIVMSHLGLRKFICQVRDPRQTMISALRWFDIEYQMSKDAGDRYKMLLYHSLFPSEYFSLNESQKIDMMIDTRFVRHLNWIDGWLKASQDREWGFDILFTRFEDFKQRRATFYHGILDFYGVPHAALNLPPEEPTPDVYKPGDPVYFRRGSLDEWRSVVSRDQYARMMSKIPDGMLQRFGWEE